MTAAKVSVVVVTKNGARTLPAVLAAVRQQRIDVPFEIVAVDSGSTDGTVDLLKARADRLIQIPAGEYNHGLTRNAGIEHTCGDFVVLLVQDAVPESDGWLAALVTPLRQNSRVAGAFARQRARADASPMTRYYLSRWTAASEHGRTAAIGDAAAFTALAPADRFHLCVFDNVCSCIRRSVWETHRFAETPIAEDMEWARDVLLAGHELVYVPEAVVIHSHDRPVRYEFARTRVLHRRLFDLFTLRTIPTVPALVRSIASSVALHARCHREAGQLAGLGRSLGLAVAWPLGQYLGGLSGAHGRPPFRISGI